MIRIPFAYSFSLSLPLSPRENGTSLSLSLNQVTVRKYFPITMNGDEKGQKMVAKKKKGIHKKRLKGKVFDPLFFSFISLFFVSPLLLPFPCLSHSYNFPLNSFVSVEDGILQSLLLHLLLFLHLLQIQMRLPFICSECNQN